MTTPHQARLELRQRIFLMSRTQRLLMWATVLFVLVLAIGLAVMAFFALPEEKRSAEAMLERLLTKATKNPWDAALNTIMFIAIALQAAYMRLAHRHERLILTPGGIEYRSPLPWALQGLRPSWSLAWGQIRSASLQGTQLVRGPQALVLVLESSARKVKLHPIQWVDPDNYEPVSIWSELKKQRNANAADHVVQVEASEVLRYMAAAAPQLVIKQRAQGEAFALEKNRQALAVVIGFFVLLLYALGDGFFIGNEIFVEEPPYSFFAASGLLAALLAGVWMRSGGVPAVENIIVSLLFGAAMAAAAYPGTLRVNAFTDTDGLQRYEYRLTAELTFKPLAAGMPEFASPGYSDYWSHFKQGSIHEFEIRRGGLGFYQLNMQPVNMAMRAYYEKQNRNNKKQP